MSFTSAGYVHKRLIDIKEDMENKWKALGFMLGFRKVEQMFVDIFAAEAADLRELFQLAYWQLDPDQSPGILLDSHLAMAGLRRIRATSTRVEVTLLGTPGTVIPNGYAVEMTDTGEIFRTTQSSTIGALGAINVFLSADVTGPTEVPLGTLVNIVDAVPGWTGVSNHIAAEVGRFDETDLEARNRLREQKAANGAHTIGAIQAKLYSDVSGVSFCRVHMPSVGYVEAVVDGGADQDIADLLWAQVAGGILTKSNAAVAQQRHMTVVDADGVDQPISFSRFEYINIYIRVLVQSHATLSTEELATIEEVALRIGNTIPVGGHLHMWRFDKSVNATSVTGIQSVTDVVSEWSLDGTNWSPNEYPTNGNQRLIFDPSRVSAAQI